MRRNRAARLSSVAQRVSVSCGFLKIQPINDGAGDDHGVERVASKIIVLTGINTFLFERLKRKLESQWQATLQHLIRHATVSVRPL